MLHIVLIGGVLEQSNETLKNDVEGPLKGVSR
jgi:hypothetical protein